MLRAAMVVQAVRVVRQEAVAMLVQGIIIIPVVQAEPVELEELVEPEEGF